MKMVCLKILLPFKVESSLIPRHGYPTMPWYKDNWKAENRKLDKNRTLCKKLHASYLVHILNRGQPRTHSNLILFMSSYKKQGVVQQSISWHEIPM